MHCRRFVHGNFQYLSLDFEVKLKVLVVGFPLYDQRQVKVVQYVLKAHASFSESYLKTTAHWSVCDTSGVESSIREK